MVSTALLRGNFYHIPCTDSLVSIYFHKICEVEIRLRPVLSFPNHTEVMNDIIIMKACGLTIIWLMLFTFHKKNCIAITNQSYTFTTSCLQFFPTIHRKTNSQCFNSVYAFKEALRNHIRELKNVCVQKFHHHICAESICSHNMLCIQSTWVKTNKCTHDACKHRCSKFDRNNHKGRQNFQSSTSCIIHPMHTVPYMLPH